jgi:hypothetical protein
VLSASANKLAKLKEQAEEYAALIMEELDPENLGYIEVRACVVRGRILYVLYGSSSFSFLFVRAVEYSVHALRC